jgi:uncharacterized Tic20 family protein
MTKDQEVSALIEEVLNTIPERGEDITDQVFLAIENNPDWLEQYNGLVDDYGKNPVNMAVGRYTRELTGFESTRQSRAASSSLAGTYTVLVPDKPSRKVIKIAVVDEDEAPPADPEETIDTELEPGAALREAIARAEAEDAEGRDVVQEYQSKYYGSPTERAKAEPRRGRDHRSTPTPPPPPIRRSTRPARQARRQQHRQERRQSRPARRQAPPAPVAPPLPKVTPLTSDEERLWAAISHASLMFTLVVALFTGGVLLPFLLFVPLVIYFAYRRRSEFVAYHALQGFAMQLFATLGMLAVGITGAIALVIAIVVSAITIVGIPVTIVLVIVLLLFAIVVVLSPVILSIYGLYGAWVVFNGGDFRYHWFSEKVDRYIA